MNPQVRILGLIVFLASLINIALNANAQRMEERWLHNTFPGPGHAKEKGPWKPGQGSDRLEWISGFVPSPVDPNFMMMITDLGRMCITTDGKEFKPVNHPSSFGCAIAFDPHRPKTVYALMDGRQHDHPNGWWRSDDHGKSWKFIVEDEVQRIQRNTFIHDPAQRRKKWIYRGNTQGLFISKNDGRTWDHAIKSMSIHHMITSANGDALFILAGPVNLPQTGGDLYMMPRGNPKAARLISKGILDIAPTTVDGSKGVLIKDDGVYAYSQHGKIIGESLLKTRRNKRILVNPSNPKHILLTKRGTVDQWNFLFSKDGGKKWGQWVIEDGWNKSIKDFSPINHMSPDYALPVKTTAFLGDRVATGFIAGNPKAVVTWATNMVKSPLRSDDFGQNFKPFAHGGLFKSMTQIAIGDDDRVVAIAVGEYGVVITRDGGKTWRGYYNGNTPVMMDIFEKGTGDFGFRRAGWGVAFDPRDDTRMIHTYGNQPSHILLSENSGRTWKSIGTYEPHTENSWGLVHWHRQDPDIIYVHDQRSDDNGKTWKKLSKPVTAMSPSNGDVVVYKESARLFYVSRDRGESWIRLAQSPQSADTTLVVSPTRAVQPVFDPRPQYDPTQKNGRWRLLIGGQDGCWIYEAPANEPGNGKWRLTRKGIRIQDTPEWTHGWFGPMAVGYENGRLIYYIGTRSTWGKKRGGLTRRQIYRSEDGGESWKQWADPKFPGLPDRFYVFTMIMSPRSGRVYMGEYSGLYVFGKWSKDQRIIHDSGE